MPRNSPRQGEEWQQFRVPAPTMTLTDNAINSLQILQQAFKEKREDALKLFLIPSEMCQKKHVKHDPSRVPSCFTQAPWGTAEPGRAELSPWALLTLGGLSSA